MRIIGKKKPKLKISLWIFLRITGRLIKFFNNECQIASYPEVSQLGLLSEKDDRYYLQSTDGMNLAYLALISKNH